MEQKFSNNNLEAANLIAKGNDMFNKKLFPILLRNGGNLVYSPLSVHTILSLAYYGAAGETAQSLQKTLHLSDAKRVAEGYKFWMDSLNSLESEIVKMASGIFIDEQYPVKEEFSSVSKEYFLSGAENVNYKEKHEAAAEINNWVHEKTEGLIKNIADSNQFNKETHLYMVNALYFKGMWLQKFTASKDSEFFISESESVDCTMMVGDKRLPYGEDEDLDAQILKMPYTSNNTSLMIILPRSKMGIDKLCDKLHTKNLSELNNSLETALVKVSFPKCRIETTLELSTPLKELGLDIIFDKSAKFPSMLKSNEPIKVDEVVQKAYIYIYESGTEAAVATSISFRRTSSWCPPLKEVVFNADHPFVFYLCYHHEDVVVPLFVGVLKCPGKEEKVNFAELYMREFRKRFPHEDI